MMNTSPRSPVCVCGQGRGAGTAPRTGRLPESGAAARCSPGPRRGDQGPGGSLWERVKRWVPQGAGSGPCCPFGFSPASGVVSPPSFSSPHRAGGVMSSGAG